MLLATMALHIAAYSTCASDKRLFVRSCLKAKKSHDANHLPFTLNGVEALWLYYSNVADGRDNSSRDFERVRLPWPSDIRPTLLSVNIRKHTIKPTATATAMHTSLLLAAREQRRLHSLSLNFKYDAQNYYSTDSSDSRVLHTMYINNGMFHSTQLVQFFLAQNTLRF